MKYVTGYNMPGYMPDSDCSECEDLESAKAALVWDIEHYLDCMADYEETKAMRQAMLYWLSLSRHQQCLAMCI